MSRRRRGGGGGGGGGEKEEAIGLNDVINYNTRQKTQVMARGGFAVRDSYQTPNKQNVEKKGEEGKGEEEEEEAIGLNDSI